MQTLKLTKKYETYPEYKDSGVEWVGKIPKSWSILRAKNLFKKINRSPLDGDEIITAFRDGTVTLRKNKKEEGFTMADKEIGYQRIEKGDLVIHGMDAFAGAIGVSDSDGKSSPVYSACVPIKNSNPKFHAYLLRHMSKSNFIFALAKGIRERSTEFRFKEFGNLTVIEPSVKEQEVIADYLDNKTLLINQIVQKKIKLISLLQEKRTAIINHTVSKGLNNESKLVESNIDWIGRIPKDWLVRKGKYFLKHKKEINNKYQCNHVLALTLKGVMDKSDYEQFSLVPMDYASYQIFNPGDLVFKLIDLENRQTSRVGIVNERGIMSPAYIRIIPNKNINSDYFYWFYYSLYLDGIFNFLGMGVRSTLNQFDLLSQSIIIPSIKEQNDISSYLKIKTAEIDKSIIIIEKSIEKLKEFKFSLISNVVTGKIKV